MNGPRDTVAHPQTKEKPKERVMIKVLKAGEREGILTGTVG